MNSFLIRRLTPFFIFTLIVELVTLAIMAFIRHSSVDWSFLPMIKTIGVLLLTTFVSFLYLMIPYVLYLLILPRSKVNSRLDKFLTITIFSIYVYISMFEEVTSILFWEEFASAFNFIAVDYLVYTHEIFSNIGQAFPVMWYLLGTLAATVLIVLLSKRYLFTSLNVPYFGRRLFYTVIYLAFGMLVFINVDITNLEIGANRYNNELSKEGTYSLFSALWKKDLSYSDFYQTNEKAKNLKILQKILVANEAEFTEPEQNINRDIDYARKEKKLNVVVVIMRNMAAKFLDEERAELAPNLTKLQKEGINFSNTFATGAGSVRTAEAILISTPPLPGMAIMSRPENQKLYTLGNVFKHQGYDNKWVYGSYGFFNQMNQFFKTNGFELHDRWEWKTNEVSFANLNGACDEDVFAKTLQQADKSFGNKKPFFIMTMTTSNHHPYSFPEGKTKFEKRNGGVNYADYAIGKFLEEAATKPWFDNTLFVFTADPTINHKKDEALEPNKYQVPLIFYAPKLLKPAEFKQAISQIDIAPTILAMMNFEYDNRFYGQDVLAKGYKPRFFIGSYQKLGYFRNDVKVVLQPVKQSEVTPRHSSFKNLYLDEAIAYYQEASEWSKNLKTEP